MSRRQGKSRSMARPDGEPGAVSSAGRPRCAHHGCVQGTTGSVLGCRWTAALLGDAFTATAGRERAGCGSRWWQVGADGSWEVRVVDGSVVASVLGALGVMGDESADAISNRPLPAVLPSGAVHSAWAVFMRRGAVRCCGCTASAVGAAVHSGASGAAARCTEGLHCDRRGALSTAAHRALKDAPPPRGAA